MNKTNKYLSLLLVGLLTGCQADNLNTVNNSQVKNTASANTNVTNSINNPVKSPIISNEKLSAHGKITSTDTGLNSKNLKFSINYKAIRQGFKTQAIDCGTDNGDGISRIRISISGIGISTTLYADDSDNTTVDNTISVANSTDPCAVNAIVSSVPYGKARVATIESYDSTGNLIPGATVKAVFDVDSDPENVRVDYDSTPAAKIIESMIVSSPTDPSNFIASKVNLVDLQTKINAIGADHPSLINSSLIATDLKTNGGNASTLNAGKTEYKIAPATVTGNIIGLVGTDRATIRVDDPASLVKTVSANGTADIPFNISTVTPGNWKTYITFDQNNVFTYTVTSPTTPITTDTTSVTTKDLGNITLNAATKIESLSVTNGKVDSTFVINGAGLTGTSKVMVGTESAEYVINSDTSITVTVPAGTGTGDKAVTITKDSTSYPLGTQTPTSLNYTVDNRTIYVNDDVAVAGLNTGNGWTDAYNNLEIALNKSNSGDKIWVAAGTYKPTKTTTVLTQTTDVNDVNIITGAKNVDTIDTTTTSNTFQMKTGVQIYGGFAGTEADTFVETSPRISLTTLDGDLGTINTTTDNALTVVKGASTATLDGFTIKNGNNPTGNGGGMLNMSVSPTLKNLVFSSNNANRGGGLYSSGSTGPVTNVNFFNNSALIAGGGMYSNGATGSIDNAIFSQNKNSFSNTTYGGGLHLEAVTSAVLKNIVFYKNESDNGGGMSINGGSGVQIINSTFFNNSAGSDDDDGHAIYINNNSPKIVNSIFYSSGSGSEDQTIAQYSNSKAFIGYSYLENRLNSIQGNNTTVQSLGGTNLTTNNYNSTGNNISESVGSITPSFTNTNIPTGLSLNSTTSTLIKRGGINGTITGIVIPTTDITGAARTPSYSMGAYEQNN